MGAGILPVALYRGVLFVLLGQERNDNLWSDFGGGRKQGERTYFTAIREGVEELNGILGDEDELAELVQANKITPIFCNTMKCTYTTYMFRIKYDTNLTKYFNNFNKFAECQLKDTIAKGENGLFEKRQIKWFTINELKENKIKMRLFYRDIVDLIIKYEKFILRELDTKENI